MNDEAGETINGVFVPEGVLLLEPRNIYDKALVGVAHQGGVQYAVYSEAKAKEATVEWFKPIGPGPDEWESEALEFYDFNTSGSIGTGFPVFLLDEPPV